MTKMSLLRTVLLTTSILAAPIAAQAQIDMAQKPVLVITNKAMPTASTHSSPAIYSRPARAPEITPEQISSAAFFQDGNSVVAGKIATLNKRH